MPLIGQKQGKQRWLRSEGRDKYKIVGVKLQDYLDFKKVADLMRTKDHLTTLLLPFALKKQEPKQKRGGLEQIKEIKEGMNKKR